MMMSLGCISTASRATGLLCRSRQATSQSFGRFLSTGDSSETSDILHTEVLTSPSSPDPSIVFLHGLLGNGKNLKTFAKNLCKESNQSGLLVDLRGHGKNFGNTAAFPAPHSFATVVDDVQRTLQQQPSPKTMIGHSWGGRIALQYAATQQHDLDRVWLLDTVPGQAHASVEHVIDTVSKLLSSHSDTIANMKRTELVKLLTSDPYNLDMAIAQWLASSFQDGTFGFDLDVVQGILPEFGKQDFYGLVEQAIVENSGEGMRIDLVRGGKNTGWSMDILRDLQHLQTRYPTKFGVHVLPEAGHWVHVDDLKGLVNIIQDN